MQRLGQLRAIGRPAAGFRALQWERGVASTSGLGGTTTPVPRLGPLAGAGYSSSTIQSRSGATFAPSLQLRFFATRPSSGPAGGATRRPPRAAGPSSRSSGAGAAARGRPRTSYAPSSSSSTKAGDASTSASAAARQRPRPSPSSSRASASAPPAAGITPRKERQEKSPGQQRASAGEGISEHKGRTLGRAPEGQEKASEDRRKLQVLSPALHQAFDEMQFPNGFTDIQYYGIPEVLKRKDTILASQTGTGKTLAYLLPLVQLLHADEKAGMQTEPRRPACLILLPNRELSKQVLAVVKSLSAHVKLRSAGITSGVKLKIQKESLASPVDIIVSTPGRFLQHFEHERVFLSELRYLVVDEGDTLFDKTFKEDIEKMLMIVRKRVEKKGDRPPQTIVVTATVTSDLSDAINTHFPTATLVATSGLHRPLPRLKHEYVDITTNDKHEPLLKVLLGSKTGGRTIVFCNDMQSARSTHHFLTEQGFKASCMHSGILPKRRAEYFDQFSSGEFPILVCTDIASRGLDTTTVDHVVLFDFPENVTGYLHRVGRTARGGRRGRVTCLLKKGEKVFSEAIDLANTKQISLSEVLPYFNRTNPGKRERLAQWLDPLALLPDQKKRQQQQQQQQQHHQQQKQQKRR